MGAEASRVQFQFHGAPNDDETRRKIVDTWLYPLFWSGAIADLGNAGRNEWSSAQVHGPGVKIQPFDEQIY